MKQPLIILTGPTATGKTGLSVKLAKAVNGEIISADSMQVYQGMDIGTAKISKEEMQGVPHHLIDVLPPTEAFNIVQFQRLAKKAMDEILQRGKLPIVVGGTGFYIQSLVYDIHFWENDGDSSFRRHLEEEAQTLGAEELYRRLQSLDAKAANKIHPNNVKKVIRALEFYHQTGMPISGHNEEERQKESPYHFAYFVLNQERGALYRRIDDRIDNMLQDGLLEEVEALYKKGYDKRLVSMQGLGYKEILSYLEGEMSLSEAIYVLKRDTRHFAKRQLTWFKREREVIWLSREDYPGEDAILDKILVILREKSILRD